MFALENRTKRSLTNRLVAYVIFIIYTIGRLNYHVLTPESELLSGCD